MLNYLLLRIRDDDERHSDSQIKPRDKSLYADRRLKKISS